MFEQEGYGARWGYYWLVAGLALVLGWGWLAVAAGAQESLTGQAAASRGGNGGQPAERMEPIPADDRIPWITLEGSEPWPETLVTVEALPNPPSGLQPLITAGRVAFRFYEADKMPRRFAGETRMAMFYRLEYSYRVRMIRVGGKRRLQVKLQHRPTEFTVLHQILLPIEHATGRLFEVPLVLHELDHVRIGIDPRYPALFDQWLREATETLTFDWDETASEADTEARVQREVDAQAAASFARLMQLMEVRQRELDRVTKHGLHPLPEAFFATPEGAPALDLEGQRSSIRGKSP